ncbi:hypothetical protein ACFORL_08480 [Legionella dresdenensis]|uniref:Uncharacterized protein n=1 Tax=Legionella dresdenensis TaxID=450200 RepID=A0ABV8CFJ1_9GAMM
MPNTPPPVNTSNDSLPEKTTGNFPGKHRLDQEEMQYFPLKKRFFRSALAAPSVDDHAGPIPVAELKEISPSTSPGSQQAARILSPGEFLATIQPCHSVGLFGTQPQAASIKKPLPNLSLRAFEQAVDKLVEEHSGTEPKPAIFMSILLQCFAEFFRTRKCSPKTTFKLYFEAMELAPDNQSLRTLMQKLIASRQYSHASNLVERANSLLALRPMPVPKDRAYFKKSLDDLLANVENQAASKNQTIAAFLMEMAQSLDQRSYLNNKNIKFTQYYNAEIIALTNQDESTVCTYP